MNEKKNIKKNKSVPMTKSTKKLLLVCLGIVLVLCILFVIGMFVPAFAEFYWLYIRNIFVGLGFKLFQFCPWIGAWYNMALVLIMWIFIIASIFIELNKKIDFKKKVRKVNKCSKFVFVIAVLIFAPMLIDFSGFNNSKINERYFNTHINDTYTKDDIVGLANYFKNKIFSMVHSFDRMDGNIVYSKDLTERSVEDLLNISDKYLFLRGMYPNKVSDFSSLERKFNNDGTMGYTKGFGVVVDNNDNNVILLNTITHELCHSKGIYRESEAEFCAYIANASSDDIFSKYSAFYNAFYRITSALTDIDSNLALDVEESFTSLCLSNEYGEACNFYRKEFNNYIEGTDRYKVVTHRLRNYKDYSNGLMELISFLTKNYDAKVYVNDKKVDLAYISGGIRNNSSEIVRIEFDADKSKFDALSGYLKEYQKYMLGFYQIDDDIEDEERLSGDEALEYYVKPFNLVDNKNLFKDEWFDEYYYERVTRLFLEYYHDEIRK